MEEGRPEQIEGKKEEGRGRRKVKERARPKHNEEHSEMQ